MKLSASHSPYHRTRRHRLWTSAWLALALTAGSVAAQQERFTYFRSLEGNAQLTSNDGSRAEAEANYPILVGDRLWLGEDGRADVLLADGSQLTVDGGTEVVFDDLAYSAEGDSKGNVLRLVRGRIALDSHGAWGGGGAHDQPVIDTENARVYLQADGAYLITAGAEGFTEVTVRAGFAEVVDQRGSSIARAGESVEIVGKEPPRSEVLAARSETEIEAWARDQEARHGRGSDPALDEPLESTATLADHGEWLQLEDRRAWRPYNTVSTWRPYYNGRWAYTPRGLYWVSSDPWSPVTYHYGAWEYSNYHGWLWYPASVWAPAHVYWYWGPSYAGWTPIGYYSHHYGGYYPGFGLRFGVYGWVGGSWDPFYNWTFCGTNYLWNRWPHRYYGYGRDFAHHGGLDRGILTTDTGHIDRRQWGRPELVHTALERGWKPRVAGEQLPDVNRFVEGKGELPEDVARQVLLKPNPTRGFDERVAAVLPRGGRDSGSSAGSGNAAGVSTRQGLEPQPAAGNAAGGQAASSQVDRRVLSRQGGDQGAGDSNARSASAPGAQNSGTQTAGTGTRASGSRQTVSRDGSSPAAGQPAAAAAAPGARSSGVRAAVPRQSPTGATPSTATRTPVPGVEDSTRVEGSSSGAERQSVGTPREPARRVLDGIRGRSRPTSASGASPAGPSTSSSTGSSRATVARSPVPRATATPPASRGAGSGTAARQPVTRAPSSGSPSGTSARAPASRSPSGTSATTTARRPVTTSAPPPSRSSSVSERSTGSRPSVGPAPVNRTSPASSRSTAARSSSTGASQRSVVRAPSQPSYSTPSRSTSSTYSRAPRATVPARATSPSAGSRPSYSAPARSTSSTYSRAPRATAPARATSPSASASRPSYSRPAGSSSGAGVSRPTYSRPAGSAAGASRPTGVQRSSSPASTRSTTPSTRSPASSSPSASRAPSGGGSSSRAATASRANGGSSSSSSRATSSSSRGSSRPSGRPGSGA